MSVYAKHILDEIASKVASRHVAMNNEDDDGRINSKLSEANVLEAVEAIVKDMNGVEYVAAPKARWWFDFALMTDAEGLIPVNVKISTFTLADNVSSKIGMLYSLTGKLPEELGIGQAVGWKKIAEVLSEHMTPNDKDYYCLVVNKNDTSDAFVVGLKSAKELVPNGSNLPFQCLWSDNRVPVERTPEEGNYFVLDVFQESWRKLVAPAEAILSLEA